MWGVFGELTLGRIARPAGRSWLIRIFRGRVEEKRKEGGDIK